MLKFNIKFIICLFFILFVNSVFANSDTEDLERELYKCQNEKTSLKQELRNSQRVADERYIQIQNRIDALDKKMDWLINELIRRKPKSIYFTGWDKVWTWHPSFDFISVTIHPRVKIHTRPSIDAPVRGWTEHEDIFISIGDIQPGPGSIRGWGRPVSYRKTKDGWINLDQLNDNNNLLWCIAQYNGTVIRYWHWENDVTRFHPEAYCVDPRQ